MKLAESDVYGTGFRYTGGKAISHDGDDSLSDNVTCSKRPRSSSSKALLLPGAARSEREHPRQRRRQQLDYATREEQTLATVRRHCRRHVDRCRRSHSGAGTIFQQGGQDQPFPAGGLGAL